MYMQPHFKDKRAIYRYTPNSFTAFLLAKDTQLPAPFPLYIYRYMYTSSSILHPSPHLYLFSLSITYKFLSQVPTTQIYIQSHHIPILSISRDGSIQCLSWDFRVVLGFTLCKFLCGCFCWHFRWRLWHNVGGSSWEDTRQREASHTFTWPDIWLWFPIQKRISIWKDRDAAQARLW